MKSSLCRLRSVLSRIRGSIEFDVGVLYCIVKLSQVKG